MAKLHLHLVPRLELPRIKDAERPYRIWDSKEKKGVRWRCYSDEIRAHNAAHTLVRWEKVNVTYEVIDIRTGACFAVYKRGLHGVEISAVRDELK